MRSLRRLREAFKDHDRRRAERFWAERWNQMVFLPQNISALCWASTRVFLRSKTNEREGDRRKRTRGTQKKPGNWDFTQSAQRGRAATKLRQISITPLVRKRLA